MQARGGSTQGSREAAARRFCSVCYKGADDLTLWSNGELFCDSCSTGMAASSLLARVDEVTGLLLPGELTGVRGRALGLLLGLRAGDALSCCGCITTSNVVDGD